MVRNTLPAHQTLIGILMVSFLTLIGCSRSAPPEIDLNRIEQALQRTSTIPAPAPHSEIEAHCFSTFYPLYAEYSAERISSNVITFTPKTLFADPYPVEGIDEIEAYFIAMAAPAQSCPLKLETSNAQIMNFIVDGRCILFQPPLRISQLLPGVNACASTLPANYLSSRLLGYQRFTRPASRCWFLTQLVKNRILKGMNHE